MGKTKAKKPFVISYARGGAARVISPMVTQRLIRERHTNFHITEGVDAFAGYSAGALYQGGYNVANPAEPDQPLYSESEMIERFEGFLPRIFNKHHLRRHLFHMVADKTPFGMGTRLAKLSKYDPENLRACVEDLTGDRKVKDLMRAQLITTRAAAQGNYTFMRLPFAEEFEIGHNLNLYDALTASCMAPHAFPAYEINLDGEDLSCLDGLLFDNPLYAYQVFSEMLNPEEYEIHMIVWGTGKEPYKYTRQFFDQIGISGAFNYAKGFGLFNELAMAHYERDMGILKKTLGSRLSVIDFDLEDYFGRSVPFPDDVSAVTLERYHISGEDVFHDHPEVEKVAELLTMRRDMRQKEASPTPRPFSRAAADLIRKISGRRGNDGLPAPTPAG